MSYRGRNGQLVKELSWRPRLRGAIYCAPACGGNCKRAAYEERRKVATALVKRLGRGWKIRMNENLGWYCHVFFQSVGDAVQLEVTPPGGIRNDGSYWINLHVAGRQFCLHSKSMTWGLGEVMRQARAHALEIQCGMNHLPRAFK